MDGGGNSLLKFRSFENSQGIPQKTLRRQKIFTHFHIGHDHVDYLCYVTAILLANTTAESRYKDLSY